MVPAMAGVDTVVFAAGSGGSTGDDMTLNIDLDGAVKAMHATELADIKRFILISALGTDDRAFWNQSGIRHITLPNTMPTSGYATEQT